MTADVTLDADHTYRLSGKVVPGVNELLAAGGYITLPQGVSPRRMDFARKRGHAGHLMSHLYDLGRLNTATLDPRLEPYLFAYEKFLGQARVRYLEIEQPRAHRGLGFAGTPDRIGVAWDHLSVIDLKLTAEIEPWYALTTGGYQVLAQDNGHVIERRLVVRLCPDGEYRFEEYAKANDVNLFLGALAAYKWRQMHGLLDEEPETVREAA